MGGQAVHTAAAGETRVAVDLIETSAPLRDQTGVHKLFDEQAEGGRAGGEELGAEVERLAAQVMSEQSAADAVVAIYHDDVAARRRQVLGGDKAGEARSDDDDGALHNADRSAAADGRRFVGTA